MASKADIGAKIGINGEKEYRRQLKEISTGLKTLGSEMRVVTSEFAGNEKSTEALTAKNDVLERQVYTLNEQLEKQEDYLKKVAQAYGEADARTQSAQQAVNKTRTAINNATHEIEKNNAQIESNDTLLGKLGINLGSVTQKLGLSSSASQKLTAAFGTAAPAVLAISVAIAKLIGKLNDFTEVYATHIDNINTLATKYHTTSQAIEALQYAEKFTDVSTETMLGSISKLTRNMESARKGTGDAAETFRALNISVTNADGSLRSSHEVFLEAIDALKGVGNETERDALAMDIFGRSAVELNGVIEAGSDGLRQYISDAERFGVTISDKANQALQAVQDEKDTTESIAEAAKTNLAAAWAPVTELWEIVRGGFWLTVNDIATGVGNFRQSGETVAAVNQTVGDSAEKVTDTLREQADALDDAADAAERATNAYDQMRSVWDEMERSGLGRVIGSYDPTTGITREGFVSDDELISQYRTGQYTGSDILAMEAQRNINLSVNLDSQTIARATYRANLAESSRVGRHAVS